MESREGIGKIRLSLKSGLECRFRNHLAYSPFIHAFMHSFNKYVLKTCFMLWPRHRGSDGPCTAAAGAHTVPSIGTRNDKHRASSPSSPSCDPRSRTPPSPCTPCISFVPCFLGLSASLPVSWCVALFASVHHLPLWTGGSSTTQGPVPHRCSHHLGHDTQLSNKEPTDQ